MPTTLAITSIQGQQPPTVEVVALQIFLSSADFAGLYDSLEVWRSELGESGPYQELTAADAKAAEIPKSSADPSLLAGPTVPLAGKMLLLRVDEVKDVAILFSSDMNYSAAAAQVWTQGLNCVTAFVSVAGEFVVASSEFGSLARLRILGGDAAPLLRLPLQEPDSLARGRDVRLALSDTQLQYSFVDWFGSRAYHYKTRFRNASTGVTSDYSQAFSKGPTLATQPSHLAIGELTILQPSGQPLVNQEVRLSFNAVRVNQSGQFLSGNDLIQSTDAAGHVEFTLFRGIDLSVSVPGTSLFRNIRVPTDPAVERFDLLSADVGIDDDNFKVAVPNLVAADRRTL